MKTRVDLMWTYMPADQSRSLHLRTYMNEKSTWITITTLNAWSNVRAVQSTDNASAYDFYLFNLHRNEQEQFCEALHPEYTLSPFLQTAYEVRDFAGLAYIAKGAPV